MRECSVGVLLVLAGALVVSAGAQGATLSFGLTPEPSKDYVAYRADRGERNRIKVKFGGRSVTISDRGARRLVFNRRDDFNPGCRRTGLRRVRCSDFRPGGFVDVIAGDMNDLVRFSRRSDTPGAVPADPLKLAENFEDFNTNYYSVSTIIDGGPGDDAIIGSQYRDRIIPGKGRDRIDGGNGDDLINLIADGSRDTIAGGGGIDDLDLSGAGKPVTVDLRAGVAKTAGDRDRTAGIERVHGGRFDDTLLGSSGPDALYGEAGNDMIDGRAGNDLLVGDWSFAGGTPPGRGNRITGGAGDDVIDARSTSPTDTSSIDCGPGADRYAGGVDASVSADCEFAAFRDSPDAAGGFPLGALFGVREPIAPVSRGADGTPTYAVTCPSATELDSSPGVCEGTIALERPPDYDSTAPPEQLGRGDFTIAKGQTADVLVTLTAAGHSALAGAAANAVHVTGTTPPQPNRGPAFDYGWQQQPLGG